MGTQKIVIDTNVLISAFGWNGTPRRVFEYALSGKVELLVSNGQFRELERVIQYPKLGFTEGQRKRFLAFVLEACTLVENSGRLAVVVEDPSDDVLLETAVEHGASWLVTGDRHLLKFKTFQGVQILTPVGFLANFDE